MFVNRVSELDLLEKRYSLGKAELFVFYGRRRVGKTELLVHFCEGKRSIFFVSDLGSEISLRTALFVVVNTPLVNSRSKFTSHSRVMFTTHDRVNIYQKE